MILLSTAALIPFKEEERKEEYIAATKQLVQLSTEIEGANCRVGVIESTGRYAPSFFEDYVSPSNVIYTFTNNTSLRNKGVNEFVSIREGMDYFFNNGLIDPNESIVKITGRYQFYDLELVRKALELIDNGYHDVVAYHHPDGQIFTGCMATRASKLYEFASSIDYNMIEQRMINVEFVCQKWAETQKTHFVDRLGVQGKCALGNPFRW